MIIDYGKAELRRGTDEAGWGTREVDKKKNNSKDKSGTESNHWRKWLGWRDAGEQCQIAHQERRKISHLPLPFFQCPYGHYLYLEPISPHWGRGSCSQQRQWPPGLWWSSVASRVREPLGCDALNKWKHKTLVLLVRGTQKGRAEPHCREARGLRSNQWWHGIWAGYYRKLR